MKPEGGGGSSITKGREVESTRWMTKDQRKQEKWNGNGEGRGGGVA